MCKIRPNKIKKRQNTPKRVSNRGIKSLENNFSVKATKNIISTPKIVIEKPQIVNKPEIVTMPKIVTKVTKPKIVDRPEIVNKKYEEYKKRVTKQLKKLFDIKKSGYLDDDDKEYKGIRDLEYLLEGAGVFSDQMRDCVWYGHPSQVWAKKKQCFLGFFVLFLLGTSDKVS